MQLTISVIDKMPLVFVHATVIIVYRWMYQIVYVRIRNYICTVVVWFL